MTTNRILQQLLFLRRHFIEKVKCMQSTSQLLYNTVYAIIPDTIQYYKNIYKQTVIQRKDEYEYHWYTLFRLSGKTSMFQSDKSLFDTH
jgi:hypothetical protein